MQNSSNSLSKVHPWFKGEPRKHRREKITKPPPGRSPGLYAGYVKFVKGKAVPR